MDDHRPTGLLDRREDGVLVERDQGTQVDDLGGDPLLGEELGRLGDDRDHCTVREQRDVGTFADESRLSEWDPLVPVGDLPRHRAVDTFRLEEHHGVFVMDRGEEETLRVGGGGRDHDLQARRVGEVGLGALGVVETSLDPAAIRGPNDDMAGVLATGSVPELCELAHDLVERGIDEIEELDLGDGLEPIEGHADRSPDDPGLGERSIEDPVLTKLLQQTLGRAEHPTVHTDVLAEEENVRVVAHRLLKAAINGLDQRQFGHGLITPSRTRASYSARSSAIRGVGVANTSSNRVEGATGAAFSAAARAVLTNPRASSTRAAS